MTTNARQRLPLLAGITTVLAALFTTFRIDLMTNRNMPTGGDMGAHHYIAKSLGKVLPVRLWAWGSGWYAGMPILHYYFPLPYAAILVISTILPYPIAFKLVASAGVATIPASIAFCLWAMDANRNAIAFGLASGLIYIYNDSYTILGGNIGSTMAGEFAYAISLSMALVLIGITYRSLIILDRRDLSVLALPSFLLGAIFLTHLLPVLAVSGAFVAILVGRCWTQRIWRLTAITIGGLGLSAVHFLPLVLRLKYTAHPRWSPSRGWAIFAGGPACDNTCQWSPATTMMVILAVAAILMPSLWHKKTLVAAAIGAVGVVATVLWPAGAVWNLRWLPIFYIGCALLASLACGEIFPPGRPIPVAIAVLSIGTFAILTSHFASPWVSYNFSGYQTKSGWHEYQSLMEALSELDDARIMWEYSDQYQEFGTTRALELIPFWTERRSMEGLLVESSITAPGHFAMQANLSIRGTGALPGLAYPSFDFEKGLEKMEIYGIRYFIAISDEVKSEARRHGLIEVNRSGRFVIYELETAGEVEVPAYRPLLGNPAHWRERSIEWLSSPAAPIVFPQGDLGEQVKQLEPDNSAPVPLDASTDAHVQVSRPSDGVIEFRTNKVGEPHIVKESWFPTWSAQGAEGPYLVSPSLMLVFPTEENVRLLEGPKALDRISLAVTVLSTILLSSIALVGRPEPDMLSVRFRKGE